MQKMKGKYQHRGSYQYGKEKNILKRVNCIYLGVLNHLKIFLRKIDQQLNNHQGQVSQHLKEVTVILLPNAIVQKFTLNYQNTWWSILGTQDWQCLQWCVRSGQKNKKMSKNLKMLKICKNINFTLQCWHLAQYLGPPWLLDS